MCFAANPVRLSGSRAEIEVCPKDARVIFCRGLSFAKRRAIACAPLSESIDHSTRQQGRSTLDRRVNKGHLRYEKVKGEMSVDMLNDLI